MTPASSSVLRPLSILAAAAALFASTEAAAAPPERTILYNGKVFTADDSSPWATAVAVQGRKIVAVGNDTQVLSKAKPGTRFINLQGRTVVPGLNDSHVHILRLPGALVNAASLPPVGPPEPGQTLSQVMADIQAATQSLPKGTWLVALVGSATMEDPNVNRFALDVVSPDHPVRLQAWSGHGTVLNSKGMETLGISNVAADPFAGTYDRVDGSAELNGVMHEYAEYDVWRRLHALTTNADARAQYEAYGRGAVQLGFTSVQDMAVGIRQSRSVSILSSADLPLRVRSICFPLTPNEPCDADGGDDTEMVTFSGIKWVTDGTPVERNAYLREPYADDPEWRGQFNLPDEALGKILHRAGKGNKQRNQILFHAVGDAAVDNVLNGLHESGGPCNWNDRRPRIEHGDFISPDNYGRALDSGVVIVQNATHLALPLFQARVTPEKYETIQPLRTLLDLGFPLALGTDGIGQAQSPWVDIFLATVHPDRPEEAITLEEAITAYTRGSAYAEFQEHRKGTIAPGMLADLAVLSQDVFTVPPPAIMGTSSVLTMVDGKIVWDAGAVGH